MRQKKGHLYFNDSDFQVLTCEIENSLTAIRKDFSLRKFFCNCLKVCYKPSYYHAIRLNIKLSGNKYERIVELITQCGVSLL